jgi:hypothetical protein
MKTPNFRELDRYLTKGCNDKFSFIDSFFSRPNENNKLRERPDPHLLTRDTEIHLKTIKN